jgi:hypothetical protein
MTDPGYYEQSYPPSLWAQPVAAAASRRGGQQSPSPELVVTAEDAAGAALPEAPGQDGTVELEDARVLTVAAGAPGTYNPPQTPAQRPRNVTDLRERAQPVTRDPWPEGTYVQVGESGKRAHWTGTEWRSGESPGYPATGSLPALPYSARDTPGTQFPGRGDGSQDLTR